jgi:hypothetical protein
MGLERLEELAYAPNSLLKAGSSSPGLDRLSEAHGPKEWKRLGSSRYWSSLASPPSAPVTFALVHSASSCQAA